MITTQAVGNLFVIVDPDGELETTIAGQPTLDWVEIHSLLREDFGDHYDFMSCYLDTDSGVLNLGCASSTIYQETTGIGRHIFNFRADWGTTRLQHYTYNSWLNPHTLLHEIGHLWLAYVNYTETPSGTAQHTLHEDWIWSLGEKNTHWGRWLDNQNSCMDYDQAEWIDNVDGTFNRIDRLPEQTAYEEWYGYSPLDQYLMGLIPPSEVPDIIIVQNPSPALSEAGPYGVPTGPYTPSPAALTVTIDQIRNTRSDEPGTWSGPRVPDHLNAQRVFHEAIVIITKNPDLASSFISDSEGHRGHHTAFFREVTAGRAMMDTSLLRTHFTELYVRDNHADRGTDVIPAPFWLSPDLWVRNDDDGGLSNDQTIRDRTNYIYVRVRNKSAQPYENVTVNVYLANFRDLVPGTEFLYPVDWEPAGLLGTITIPSVPAASGAIEGEAIVSMPWTADRIPPAAGWHPCLLCEVIPMETTPTGLHHVFENPKLGQRNLTIIDPPPPPPDGQGGGADGFDGFLFVYEFAIGHPLRETKSTRLELTAERHTENVRLFLDPAELVDGIAEYGEQLNWDIPLESGCVPSGKKGVQWIKNLSTLYDKPTRISSRRCDNDGLTLLIKRGTEVGILHDADRSDCALQVRFEDDVRIRVGGGERDVRRLLSRYHMEGMRPVVLNGLSLLEITDAKEAALNLPLTTGRKRLKLIGIVTGESTPERPLYHLSERQGEHTIGGVSLQIGE